MNKIQKLIPSNCFLIKTKIDTLSPLFFKNKWARDENWYPFSCIFHKRVNKKQKIDTPFPVIFKNKNIYPFPSNFQKNGRTKKRILILFPFACFPTPQNNVIKTGKHKNQNWYPRIVFVCYSPLPPISLIKTSEEKAENWYPFPLPIFVSPE